MENLNDCYQCGGWMTSDDIQQRDFHGLCNKCLMQGSNELDAACLRRLEGYSTRPCSRDYPVENSEDMEPSLMWQGIDGEWHQINAVSPQWALDQLKLRDPEAYTDIMAPVGNLDLIQEHFDRENLHESRRQFLGSILERAI